MTLREEVSKMQGLIVATDNLTKVYGDGVEVRALKDVTLQIDQGEFIAIQGPSGSGKTTLLNLIGTLDVPTSGRVMVDGVDVSTLRGDALVDVRMPGPSGMALTERLKELWPEMEIIIITAYGSITNAASAVRRGAFHYLPKPLSPQQVQAVVEEALEAQRARVRVGEWVVDLREGHVTSKGKLAPLTTLEERLLVCLARRGDRVVSYEDLWCQVWSYDGPPDKGAIHKVASRLREKVGQEWIVAVRGRGYRLW